MLQTWTYIVFNTSIKEMIEYAWPTFQGVSRAIKRKQCPSYMAFRPDKSRIAFLDLSWRCFIVCNSLSVQATSSVSLPLEDDGVEDEGSGKIYSDTTCSKTSLWIHVTHQPSKLDCISHLTSGLIDSMRSIWFGIQENCWIAKGSLFSL